jgi:Na+/H+ antiporter
VNDIFLIAVAVGAAVVLSLALSRTTDVPSPVVLVLAGIGVSFAPGLPAVILKPDVVFYVFLPPLLYAAAFFTSPRDLRANWLPIALLAGGLVLLTMFAVAGASASATGIGWGAAFGLGAIVAPTDPVSATAVLGRLGAPQRLRTILEGESLVNDGVALVVYKLAVGAALGASVSIASGTLRFAEMAAGGIAIGLVLGAVVSLVRRRVHDTEIEIVISLLTPYVAYVPAERAHVSGVLATVTTGVFLSWQSSGIFLPQTRLQAFAFWNVLVFLLESILFVLLGAQLPVVLRGLGGYGGWSLGWYAAATIAVVMMTRLVSQLAAPRASWRARVVLGWSGMRGAITLAAALALPLDFPHRNLVLYLAFMVVLGTLVAQGVTLRWLVGRLGLAGGERAAAAEHEARRAMLEAALARAEDMDGAGAGDELAMIRRRLEERLARLGEPDLADSSAALTRELIGAQRAELDRLARAGDIDVDTVRRLQHELDVEEVRL